MIFISVAYSNSHLNLLSFSRCVAAHVVTSLPKTSVSFSIAFSKFQPDVLGFIYVPISRFYRLQLNSLL